MRRTDVDVLAVLRVDDDAELHAGTPPATVVPTVRTRVLSMATAIGVDLWWTAQGPDGPGGSMLGNGRRRRRLPNGGAKGLATTIFSALASGALYALTAVLLTIPLVRCGIINFAQMFYVVLGGYVVVELLATGGARSPSPAHSSSSAAPWVPARSSSRSGRPGDATNRPW